MARWSDWVSLPIAMAAASACLHSPPSPPSGDGGVDDQADLGGCSAPAIDQLIDDFDGTPDLAWEMVGTDDLGCTLQFSDNDLFIERTFGEPCYVVSRQAYDLAESSVFVRVDDAGTGMPDLTFGLAEPDGQGLYAVWTAGIVRGCYGNPEDPCSDPQVLAGQGDGYWRLSHHDNALWAHTHDGQSWQPELMVANGITGEKVSCVSIVLGSVATTGDAMIRVDGINVNAP